MCMSPIGRVQPRIQLTLMPAFLSTCKPHVSPDAGHALRHLMSGTWNACADRQSSKLQVKPAEVACRPTANAARGVFGQRAAGSWQTFPLPW